MNDTFHYPPDLFDLVVQTIPLLNRSKKSVLLFFKSAGVDERLFQDITTQVADNRDSITKYEITRIILERINKNTDKHLRERRELLKRITEFEAYSTCWENDQLKAKGLVSEISKVINVKDSFTRMKQERENEAKKRKQAYEQKIAEIKTHRKKTESIKNTLFSLFTESDFQKRGKKLEKVLNEYFKSFQILIKEDFKRVGNLGEGVVEQIDGIIEVDNQIYLVEMKWKKDSIGCDDIYAHLGRIYHRTSAHGIFISASGYSPSGINAAKEALLKNAILILFDLEEYVKIIEAEVDLKQYIRDKIRTAIIDKEPYKNLISFPEHK